jgi:hypothetical protein
MWGRLNIFQMSMLLWNDLHPYNAVHVVRIPAPLEFERLQTIINTVLARHRLQGLTLNRKAGTYQYEGTAVPPEIRLLTPDAGGAVDLTREIEHQLNTPFIERSRFSPFRFFVAPEKDSFSLGMGYFHAIADAESILLMLKDIIEVYRGISDPDLVPPVDRYPKRRDHLLWFRPDLLLRKLASIPSLVGGLRRTCRPYYRDISDFQNRCVLFALSPSTLKNIIQAAKSYNVTFNDLLLALLMKAISIVTPNRMREPRRQGLSLGCVVNLRKDLGLANGRAFGLFLGSFVVHHAAPEGIQLADLARDIGRQTLRIKRHRLYLGTSLELALGRLILSFFSGPRRHKFYQNNYPLWGGVTNMDLNSLWPQTTHIPPVGYSRAVSTGPITPLVLSITTLGQSANIGLSYRSTAFSAPEIERIKGCFLNPQELLTH